MKRLFCLTILLIVCFSLPLKGTCGEQTIKIYYFYSPTCSQCGEVSSFLSEVKKSNNLDIKKFNITDAEGKALNLSYCNYFNVPKEFTGEVPAIFIKNKFYIGAEKIKENLEYVIMQKDNLYTPELEKHNNSITTYTAPFKGYRVLGVVTAGFLNGLNPCSLSLLLFFLSLLAMDRKKALNLGLCFIAGKVLAYTLLGTVLYKLLAHSDFFLLNSITPKIVFAVLLLLSLLSFKDFMAARKEKYHKIILQLPSFIKKHNHRAIKVVSGYSGRWAAVLLSLLLGIIISLGEFLCTGQLYLATIVTVLHSKDELSLRAFIYLLLYVISFVLPLLLALGLVYKGKEIFDLSEYLRGHMPAIKLINSILFIILGITALLFF